MSANHSSQHPDSVSNDALFEEATGWYLRLRETKASQTDFKRWLMIDPQHRIAYREVEQLWGKLEQPAAHLASASTHRATVRLPAIAATLLLLISGGLIWHQDSLTDPDNQHVTHTGEQLPLALGDGSTIQLNTESVLDLNMEADPRHVRLLRGQAWFEVATDPQHPFIVDTPSGQIRVTGTRFDVRIIEDSALISLAEGRVELIPAQQTPASARLILAPGQQARLSADGISELRHFDAPTVTAWRRGQLVFYDTPLRDVITELNRYRSGHIMVTSPDLETLKVSGVFRTDHPDDALQIIANTLPVTVSRLTDYLVLLH